MTKPLQDILNEVQQHNGAGFYQTFVSSGVIENLKESFELRPYQKEALGRFIYYSNYHHQKNKKTPTQLLYHMATGSGKTLIMAGLILYLYEKGYRNFLFFVNSTNIIEKTRDNFLNSISSKYLFADKIVVDGTQIKIKEVNNFQAANPQDINLVFSTIQGLHLKLNAPKENSLTYDDFENNEIIFISDEAHHINAETKKSSELNAEDKETIISWEGTINRIFRANAGNLLLEFTATADMHHPAIQKKYSGKLIFDYSLKQFRLDGYSKEVKVLQSGLPPFERALQAVILSQYRRKLFEQYKKPVKPVILFKSKTIKESQSFYEEFSYKLTHLNEADLERTYAAGKGTVIEKAFDYFKTRSINIDNLITELQEDFSQEKLISVNSKEETTQKQLAINSLEDEANEYRAVFAVDKLNEGWDVLNLFDIVRLYNTKDNKNGSPGKTTMAEAQLIGRGARYFPFRIRDTQSYHRRKFDDNRNHELRIGEELYYHSVYNPTYIQELNTALEETGIKAEANEEKNHAKAIVPVSTKEKREKPTPKKLSLSQQVVNVKLSTDQTISDNIFSNVTAIAQSTIKEYALIDFGDHIIQKAINKLPFYQFNHIKKILPGLPSIKAFINFTDYLRNIKVKLETAQPMEVLSADKKLEVCLNVLQQLATLLTNDK